MTTGTKHEKHGQIFFMLGDIKGELLLTHEQGEEFRALVAESSVFSGSAMKDFLGIGSDVTLTVTGWTFSKDG
jgi:hypothetical protein